MKKIFFIVLVLIGNLTFTPQLAHAQSCQVPAQVTGVAITFPNCVGNQCDFTQGGCSWNVSSDATNYQVVITEVETSTTILNQQVASSSSTISFPVRETNTYRCDVSSVNSCGTGTAGTSSLLCKVDAAVTTTPTFTPIPTTPFVPPTTLPETGSNMPLLLLSLSGFVLIAAGLVIFGI